MRRDKTEVGNVIEGLVSERRTQAPRQIKDTLKMCQKVVSGEMPDSDVAEAIGEALKNLKAMSGLGNESSHLASKLEEQRRHMLAEHHRAIADFEALLSEAKKEIKKSRARAMENENKVVQMEIELKKVSL